jgi:TonB family protein
MRKPALLASLGAHFLALLLLALATALVPRALPPHRPPVMRLEPRRIVLPRPAKDSGGGQQSNLLARQGKLPERLPHKIFVPVMRDRSDQPKLAIQPALLDAPDLPFPMASLGDPYGVPGGGGGLGLDGLGNGSKGGIGDGDQPGFGSPQVRQVKITRQPQVLYKEEPEYSEAARKARFQGTVTLYIDVGLDGRATNIRVVRGAGLGLDENAVEAVRKWRFTPAIADGKPVIAPAVVEIGFHLL